jgi:hypothetical protein
MIAMRPLTRSLGAFAVKDLDKLNHASELLAAAATSVQQTNVAAKGAINQLIYEANQDILAVMKKPAAAFERWHQRNAPKPIAEEPGGDAAETV